MRIKWQQARTAHSHTHNFAVHWSILSQSRSSHSSKKLLRFSPLICRLTPLMGFSSSSFFVFIQQAPPSTTAVTTPFLHAVKHKLIYVCARNFCVLSIVFAFFLPFYFLLFFTSDLQFHCHFIFICWYIFIYKKHVYTFIFFLFNCKLRKNNNREWRESPIGRKKNDTISLW